MRYSDDFLTFSQPGRDTAAAFTLDSQGRLVGVNNGQVLNVYRSGTSNPAYFSSPSVLARSSTHAAANCSISASDSLSCAYGVQESTSLSFGSANNTVDANGHLYLSGNVTGQGNKNVGQSNLSLWLGHKCCCDVRGLRPWGDTGRRGRCEVG